MTNQEAMEFLLSLPDSILDYPFTKEKIPVFRHKSNQKWFAFLIRLQGKECMNLKGDPVQSILLRSSYQGIEPGWHMNKEHWNTIELCSDVPDDLIRQLIRESYQLTAPGKLPML